jgi:RNA polymerase sigma-70 factor (ECF subfamily)
MSIEKLDNEMALVQEMQAGNEESFTILYKYYSPKLYLNILQIIHDKEMTEELVQELFTRIWQKRNSIGLKENFSGYMYRIAQNLTHDYFRKIKKDKKLLERFRLLAEEHYDNIEEALRRNQSTKILTEALQHLSPQQKKVYHFVREAGYTYKRAAEIMGISPQTVKEYLGAATKSIKKYILAHSDAESLFLLLLFVFMNAGKK